MDNQILFFDDDDDDLYERIGLSKAFKNLKLNENV